MLPDPQPINGKLSVGRTVLHVNGTPPFATARSAPAHPDERHRDADTWMVLDANGQNCVSIRLEENYNVVDAETPTELRAVFHDPATARLVARHLNGVASTPRPL